MSCVMKTLFVSIVFWFCCFSLSANVVKLQECNVEWNTPSQDYTGSMPVGNGNIGLNVWVEENGDLLFLIGQTEAFDENSILMKLGRVRVKSIPALPINTNFIQRLNLENGAIEIKAGSGKNAREIKLWVDANHQAIEVECTGVRPFQQIVSFECWRNEETIYTETQVSDMFRNFSGDKYNTIIYPDTLEKIAGKGLRWFHHNIKPDLDPYTVNMQLQSLGEYMERQPHPLFGRTFGGMISGDNYEVDEKSYSLKTIEASKDNSFSIYVNSEQVKTTGEWKRNLSQQISQIQSQDYAQRWKLHEKWWHDFWNRSFIYVSYDGENELEREKVQNLNRAYTLCRFLNACGGRGKLPIKFNGSIFSYGKADNPDWRRWGGPGFWFQNERLCYWNMYASGDFDLMKAWFDYYHNCLPLALYRTKSYFGHDGAYFSETGTFWGGEVSAHYGWEPLAERPEPKYIPTNTYVRRYWQNGIESLLMMAEYYNYTQDSEFLQKILLPHAEAVTMFYDQHYKRVDGKLYFSPAQSLETWHEATNPLPEIAGLRYVLSMLLEIEDGYAGENQTALWQKLLGELPEIPTKIVDGKKMLSPAETYSNRANVENPEMYAVFPYRLFGVGKPNIEWAISAQQVRTFKSHTCWSQDDVQYALLGQVKEVSEYILKRASSESHSDSRFPAFWNAYYDWIPDIDHGGNLMLALQFMLLQPDGKKLNLLPSWPAEWDVDFKLHAPDRTIVEGTYRDGHLKSVSVFPKSRENDLIYWNPVKIEE